MPQSEARDRARPLKVFVTASERAYITRSAEISRMSVSQYLRTVGLHGRPKNMLDLQAVGAMHNASGDLGRLGGLLKLWLSERPNEGVPISNVRDLLRELESGLHELRMRVRSIGRL